MTSAKVLVAFAIFAAVPNASSVGNVISVPPPATALISPAAAADASNPAISSPDMPGHYALSTEDFGQPPALATLPMLKADGKAYAAAWRVSNIGVAAAGAGAADLSVIRLRGPSARTLPRQTTVPFAIAANQRTPRAELRASSRSG